MTVLLHTFDLEEWWHVIPCPFPETQWNTLERRAGSYTREYLDFLDSVGAKATFFVLGWMAEKDPCLVREIVSRGHDLGCHSMLHESVESLGPQRFRADLRRSKSVLEHVTGSEVNSYRAPSYTITPKTTWAFEILVDCGFSIDASVSGAYRLQGGGFAGWPCDTPFRLETRSGLLLCFPMSGWRIAGKAFTVTGGGYLRVMPKALLRLHLSKQRYVMTYLHPADFDRRRPKIRGDGILGWARRGLRFGDLWAKLEMIHSLRGGTSIKQYAASLDLDSLPKVRIGR